jgi:hypothetical protein
MLRSIFLIGFDPAEDIPKSAFAGSFKQETATLLFVLEMAV